ncbi:MAG: cyclic nucleotide-binding domain-containing protein [Myxococcota bacterium]|nr:cyclic nucleotide-binding domain-containing protein [Myxococcota bacterium]
MKDVRALKDKATLLVSKGKLGAGLEAWQQVVTAAPDEIVARQKVAELLQRLGRTAEAVQGYEEVAQRYARMGQFFKASAICRLLLTIEPVHQRTQELIASLYAHAKPVPVTARGLPRVDAAGAKPAPAPEPDFELDIEVELAPPPSGLPAIPLFSTLTEAELKEILGGSMEIRSFGPGEVLVAEGAPGDSMFAVVEGGASVYRAYGSAAQRKVAEVASGDIFGEAAMVSGGPRLATVVSEGDVVVLEFGREAMSQVSARHPRVGQKLDLFYRQRLLKNILRASPLLRSLPEADKQTLSERFQPCHFVAGQSILRQGQPVDSVHLLLRGVCSATGSNGERYPDLVEGDLFGEVSLLTDGIATASVAAAAPVLTLRLSADEFRSRVLAHEAAAQAVRALAEVRLRRTEALGSAPDAEAGVDLRV